jgi:hypothetical protein
MRVRSGAPVGPAPPPTSNNRSAAQRRPRAFTTVLGERAGPAASPAPAAPPPAAKPISPPRQRPAAAGAVSPAPAGAVSPAPVRALLERALGAERRVDTLLAAAARGKTFSPGELLALQATVFNYSQAVEVVSRATDKLVGAVKQTLGTQV